MDIYVSDAHPWYVVWVDGMIYDVFTKRRGPRLTPSELYDVAEGYREGLDSYVPAG